MLVATTRSACNTIMPVTEAGSRTPDSKSTIKICEVMLTIPPRWYNLCLDTTFAICVFTKLRPRALDALLMTACSAKNSPIQPFSRSSAPTMMTRLLPATSYEWRRFETIWRRPRPRAIMRSESSLRSSWNMSCWNSCESGQRGL